MRGGRWPQVIFVTELGQLLDTTGVAKTVEDTSKFVPEFYTKVCRRE
jgi:hypothetical protein